VRLLPAASFLIALWACSSTPPENLPPPQALTSESNEPAWVSRPWSVSDQGVEGTTLYAVGFAPRNTDLSIQLEIARSRARSELARIIATLVTAVTRDIRQTLQQTRTESKAFGVIQTEQIAQELLQGSRQVDVWRDSHDGLWVLVKLPIQEALGVYRKSLLSQLEREGVAQETLKRLQASCDRVIEALLQQGASGIRSYLGEARSTASQKG